MLNRQYKKKNTDQHGAAGELWKIVAEDGSGRWVLTPVAFGPNVPYSPTEIRREFTRAGDVEPPAAPTYDDQTAGWAKLSAEQKFAAYAQAAEDGTLVAGDYLSRPGVSGEQVPAREPLTKDDIGALKRHARRLRGPAGPTPEDVFNRAAADEITAAADRVWNSGGPDGLLARYEVGSLEVGAAIAQVLDARISARDRAWDRSHPLSDVLGGRRERE